MGKLKQPKSLETLAIESSAKWLYNIGFRLISECMARGFIDEIKDDDENGSDDEEKERENLRSANRKTLEKLELVIVIMHDYFEKCVPFYLYRKLQDEVMKNAKELIGICKAGIEFKANMARFHLQVGIGGGSLLDYSFLLV